MSDPKKTAPGRQVVTRIQADRCVGCGLCTMVCPMQTLTIEDGKAMIRGNNSLHCDHCAAACPTQAIEVPSIDTDLARYRTFSADWRWLPPGRFDTSSLVNLMGSRRSCRNYTDQPVDRSVLEDLVKVGILAPSGSNCQPWTFTLLPDRAAVNRLGQQVGDFFRKTNRLAENRWLRWGLKLMGKPALDNYYRDHYQTVQMGLAAWDGQGRDLLFHGATAAIVVAAQNDASCPGEDALLATGHILLAAHAMGVGTCLIGFVIEAMRRDRSIVQGLGIPDQETVHAVIALGWPDETYQRVAGRKPVTVRYA